MALRIIEQGNAAFRIIEQGNLSRLERGRKLFEARVDVEHTLFMIVWDSMGLVKIYRPKLYEFEQYVSDVFGYKFANRFEKLLHSKSKEQLTKYLKMGMDKIINNAKHGRLRDICEYSKATESGVDPIDNMYNEGHDESLYFDGIMSVKDLVSAFGISPNNDSQKLRKKLVSELENEKEFILEKLSRP